MVGKVKAYQDAGLDAGFLHSELPGRASREQVLLAPRATRTVAGTVLGKVLRGAASVAAAAQAGNTGNGAMSAVSADAGVAPGQYRVEINEIAANGGGFTVSAPGGEVVGVGNVGVAFDGPVNFLLSDGATDFALGDAFVITVGYAAGSGQVAPLDFSSTSGLQTVDSILLLGQPENPTGTKRCAVVARGAEVNGNLLIWPVGITADQKKAAEALLAQKGILVRY